jgi:hypothetical protein
MNFTLEQRKMIYNAVRYYQMNRVPHAGKDYVVCDDILNGLFKEVKATYVEPAYEVQPVAPVPPTNGFGFNA